MSWPLFCDSDLPAAENPPVEIAMVAADFYVALETAAVFHEGSTLVVVFNAFRLLNYRGR